VNPRLRPAAFQQVTTFTQRIKHPGGGTHSSPPIHSTTQIRVSCITCHFADNNDVTTRSVQLLPITNLALSQPQQNTTTVGADRAPRVCVCAGGGGVYSPHILKLGTRQRLVVHAYRSFRITKCPPHPRIGSWVGPTAQLKTWKKLLVSSTTGRRHLRRSVSTPGTPPVPRSQSPNRIALTRIWRFDKEKECRVVNWVRHNLDRRTLSLHLCTNDGCFRRKNSHASLSDWDTF